MVEELTLKEEAIVRNFFQAVANDLGRGRSKRRVVRWLEKQGWSTYYARELVDNVKSRIDLHKAALTEKESAEATENMLTFKRDSGRHMLYGLGMAAGGIAVTVITYIMAEGGGTYIIAHGAILAGIIEFARGIAAWTKRKP